MVTAPDDHTTNILEGREERIKVEKELTKVEEEVDSNHSFNATTNEDRESSLERNLLQEADADNSLDKNLLQKINNSYGEAIEQNMLQDAEVDNSGEDAIKQNLQPSLARDPPNSYRIFFVEKSTSPLVMSKQRIMVMLAQE